MTADDLTEDNWKYVRIMKINNPDSRRITVLREMIKDPGIAILHMRDEDPYLGLIAKALVNDLAYVEKLKEHFGTE